MWLVKAIAVGFTAVELIFICCIYTWRKRTKIVEVYATDSIYVLLKNKLNCWIKGGVLDKCAEEVDLGKSI